jgi:quercetin dioxygenase-like cupin family protein
MPLIPLTEDTEPDFAREALLGTDPSERRELAAVVHRLPEVLAPTALPPSLRARLLDETSRAPERYAPFARGLSELYDLPRDQVRQLLMRSAEPSAWQRSGLPGIKTIEVPAGPSCRGAQAYLVTFAAGARFPEHHHDGRETVLLLAGAYTEGGGRRFVSGDVHEMQPGTAHSFEIDDEEDCVAASLLYGKLNFRSWPLRLLARLLGH